MVEFSFHSLESVVCLDSLSTFTFIDPDKNSTVILIFRFKRCCKISLLITVNFLFLVPFIFIKYDRTVMLVMRMSTNIVFFFFNVKDITANLVALKSKIFI